MKRIQSAMVLAGTDGNQGHIRMFANQVFSFSSRIINGSRKRGISDEVFAVTALYHISLLMRFPDPDFLTSRPIVHGAIKSSSH